MVRLRRRRGFTLIEIVMVFIAIAIVGIVTLLVTTDVFETNRARRADNHANEVLLAEQAFAQQYGGFTGFPGDLGTYKDFDVVVGPSDTPDEVSIALGENGTLGIAVRRDDSRCVLWRAVDLATGGGSERVAAPTSAACDGIEALTGGEALDTGAATTSRARA